MANIKLIVKNNGIHSYIDMKAKGKEILHRDITELFLQIRYLVNEYNKNEVKKA